MAERVYRRELADGTVMWDAVAHIPDPITGRRKKVQKSFRREREGKKWVTEQESAVDNGTAVLPSSMTVGDLMGHWLEHSVKHQRSPKTYITYECVIRLHIVAPLGRVKVQKLTSAQVQYWQTKLLDAGVGARTVWLARMNLKQALEEAVKMGTVPRNVVTVVSPPRYQTREMDCWTVEEARRFLAVAKNSSYGPIWVLALVTGLRKGELLGLRWQDIDWEAGTLRVAQTIGSERGKIVFKGVKRPKSRRTLDLSSTVLDILREHRRAQDERRKAATQWDDTDLIFRCNNPSGTPINPTNVNNNFNYMVKLAGVKKIRIHDTRHSYTTLALLAGTPISVVSKSLGHSGIAITLGIYAHVMPEQSKELAKTMGSLLLNP